jgi:hypothetical protein
MRQFGGEGNDCATSIVYFIVFLGRSEARAEAKKEVYGRDGPGNSRGPFSAHHHDRASRVSCYLAGSLFLPAHPFSLAKNPSESFSPLGATRNCHIGRRKHMQLSACRMRYDLRRSPYIGNMSTGTGRLRT